VFTQGKFYVINNLLFSLF